jgi:hypothetical protein
MVTGTWDTHQREDVAERIVLPAQSRTKGTRVPDVGMHMEYATHECFGG